MTKRDRPPAGIAGVRDDLIRMSAQQVGASDPLDTTVDIRTAVGLRAEDVADEPALGTLVGYPIVFSRYTEIHSWWEGDFRESIDPGALTNTLAKRGERVKVLFNHGMDPQIGDKPLGKASVQEPRAQGMWGEVPLSDTSYNRDLAALIRDGAIDGMSFRFTVVKELWDEEPDDGGLPTRDILELNLFEWGPVTFPAYEATSVGIRSVGELAAWRSGDPAARSAMLTARAQQLRARGYDIPEAGLVRATAGVVNAADETARPGYPSQKDRTASLAVQARAAEREAAVARLRERVAAYSD